MGQNKPEQKKEMVKKAGREEEYLRGEAALVSLLQSICELGARTCRSYRGAFL